jgi:light-harvesting complex II chlorophyll a/b binding protein 7
MLGAQRVDAPGLLALFGIVHFVEPVWWKVGYAKLQV